MDLAAAISRLPADDLVALRPWRADDAPALAVACDDPDVQRWTLVPDRYTESDAEAFIAYATESLERGASVEVAMVAPADPRALLGSIGLLNIDWDREQAEVGYWTAAHARRRGVATRAVGLLSVWAFAELPLTRLHLTPFAANTASQRVAERAGYRREGLLRAYYRSKTGLEDVVMLSRLRDDG
jgi:RimJ/RimL family protein N-acetyltransferase